MLIRRFLFVASFIFLGHPASAQEPTLVIENGRVIVGDGTVLESGTIVVSGDRIVSVGTEPEASPGAVRIDATGRTVLPGLIDTHVHVTMERLFEQPRSDEAMLTFVREGVPDRLRAYIEAGITTVMSPGEFWPFIEDVRRRIESGELVGPRMRTAGPLFTAREGHPAVSFCGFLDTGGPNPWCREHLTVEVETSQEVRSAVTRLSRGGVDLIKLVYEESPATEPLPLGLIREIIEVAHERGLRAYGHITEPGKAVEAVEMGLDGLVHVPAALSPPEELERLLDLMRSDGVAASTTLTIYDSFADMSAEQGDEETAARMRTLLAGMKRTLARLSEVDAGIVVLGTDSPHLSPADAYHREIRLVAEVGLSPERVLQAATRDAASHIGLGPQLGTLEVGKVADIIVVGGNPLEDLSSLRDVKVVVKGGQIVVQN